MARRDPQRDTGGAVHDPRSGRIPTGEARTEANTSPSTSPQPRPTRPTFVDTALADDPRPPAGQDQE